MTKKITAPPQVDACCRTLREAGFAAHPVGGGVRDLLLGRAPTDWDVATSALPEQTVVLFPAAVPTGLRHGTVTVPTESGPIEVTTFRRESAYSDGRHPDSVSFVPNLSDDLSRRDFTVNAMALGADSSMIDLFGGLDDLAAGVLRCVGNPAARFEEDRLRMFRALRFAAQLDFILHPSLLAALETPYSTAGLAPERVRAEVEKALLSPRPEWAGKMGQLGLLEPWLGPVSAADTAPLAALPPLPLARWAGLVALWSAPHLPTALRLEGKLIRGLEGGWTLYQAGLPNCETGWRQALAQWGETPCRAAAWMAAVNGYPDAPAALEGVLGSHPCVAVGGLALSGGALAALGLSGPEIGMAQRALLAHVLVAPQDNTPARLMELLPPELFPEKG